MSQPIAPEVVDKAIATYEGGVSLESSAESVGMGSSTLSRYMKQRGVTVRRPVLRGRTPEERFWAQVNRGDETDCWLWLGAKSRETGYGNFKPIPSQCLPAHRAALMLSGVELDDRHVHHKCGTRLCVNPVHLELLTVAEHRQLHEAEKTHCKRGHPFSGDNLYICPRGWRECRTCRRESARKAA